MSGTKIQVEGTSRTDSGVHALKQVIHFDLARKNKKGEWTDPFTSKELMKGINYYLKNEDISIWDAKEVPDDWHCRKNILKKTYIYRVSTNARSSPFEIDTCWNIHNSLNLKKMQEAASLLSGIHNFNALKNMHGFSNDVNPIREVSVSVELGNGNFGMNFHHDIPFYQFTFQSKAFMYKQVRHMAAAIVEVGRGDMEFSKLKEKLNTGVQNTRVLVAPACGLYLADVQYLEEGT